MTCVTLAMRSRRGAIACGRADLPARMPSQKRPPGRIDRRVSHSRTSGNIPPERHPRGQKLPTPVMAARLKLALSFSRLPLLLSEPLVDLAPELSFDICEVAGLHTWPKDTQEATTLSVSGVCSPNRPRTAAAEPQIKTNRRAITPNIDPFRERGDLFLVVTLDSFAQVKDGSLPIS